MSNEYVKYGKLMLRYANAIKKRDYDKIVSIEAAIVKIGDSGLFVELYKKLLEAEEKHDRIPSVQELGGLDNDAVEALELARFEAKLDIRNIIVDLCHLNGTVSQIKKDDNCHALRMKELAQEFELESVFIHTVCSTIWEDRTRIEIYHLLDIAFLKQGSPLFCSEQLQQLKWWVDEANKDHGKIINRSDLYPF